jgi:CheY-like chemotaxis protein
MADEPKLRVLLVDDEPLIISALGRWLRLRGIEVLLAGNGQEALSILAQERVDLVLSDIRMPVLDGPGLLRALGPSPPAPPLVFLTGYGDHGDDELVAMGARAVLGKPVGGHQLLEAVNLWARATA